MLIRGLTGNGNGICPYLLIRRVLHARYYFILFIPLYKLIILVHFTIYLSFTFLDLFVCFVISKGLG